MASLDSLGQLLGLQQQVSQTTGINLNSFYLMGIWIAYGIIIFGAIAFLVYTIWKSSKYKIDVTIYDIVGEKKQVIRRYDKAAIVRTKEGKEKFKLMKIKGVKLPPPRHEDYTLGVKKIIGIFPKIVKCIDLIHYGSSDYDYLPITLKLSDNLENTKFAILPYANLSWAINEIQADTMKFAKINEMLQKYLLPVSLVFIILMVLIVAWLVSGNIRELIQLGSQVAAQCGSLK